MAAAYGIELISLHYTYSLDLVISSISFFFHYTEVVSERSTYRLTAPGSPDLLREISRSSR